MSANNFRLTLDTIAPNGAFESPVSGITYVQRTIEAEFDTDNAHYMKVWADSHAASWYNDTENASAVATIVAGETWIPASSTHTFNLNPDGQYYLHAIFMDDVGNQSGIEHSAQVVADNVAPTISLFNAEDPDSHSHTHVNNDTFIINITADDSLSHLDRVVITGNIDGSPKTINASSFSGSPLHYSGNLTFSGATQPSLQTLTIVAYDKSGNSSTTTTSIYYDKTAPTATLTLNKAGTNNELNQYISDTTDTSSVHYNLYDAVIAATGDNTDIAGYKIWEGAAGDEPSSYTDWPQTTPATTTVTVSGRSFSTSDGTKTVNVKLIDKAGNEYTVTPAVTRVYDATAPVVIISTDHAWIAAGNGTINAATITYTATEAGSGLVGGAPTFQYKKGSSGTWRDLSQISGGSFTFDTSVIADADKTGGVAGAYTIKISATDNAGNVATDATVVVNIEETFTIDSLVLGGWDLYSGYYNGDSESHITVQVNNSTAPGSGRANLKVWTDQTSGNTTVPDGAGAISWTSASQTVASASIVKDFDETDSNYLHVKATSAVGNVVYAHIAFTCDYHAPTYTLTMSTPTPTNSRTININIASIADTLSGPDKMMVIAGSGTAFDSGDDSDWVAWANGTRTLELASSLQSGNYEVIVKVRDKSNNIEEKSLTWEYDAIAPQGSLTLKKTDGTTAKDSPSADKQFKVNVNYTVDSTDVYGHIQYKLWGDFALTDGGAQVTEQTAVWTTLTAASIITDTLYCTPNGSSSPNGETKTVYGKLKDDAGNETSLTSASFVYNPNAATLTIQNVSDERISCVHDYRKQNVSGTITDTTKYADMVSFEITSDQSLTEIKVAAYTSGTYPSADTTGAVITPMVARSGTYGSNYNPTGNPLVLPLTVIIDGQDYRTAIRTITSAASDANVDGTHYIVVFGKNNAGTWSVAGTKVDLNS
jgi:hypothetical protein